MTIAGQNLMSICGHIAHSVIKKTGEWKQKNEKLTTEKVFR
jgi:hypothetical protein